MITSTVCRFEHFQTDWYRRFVTQLALDNPDLPECHPNRNIHRKVWEFCAIAAALDERGMLRQGRKGLGFAVGTEPLPSLFASFGAQVIATDLAPNASEHWIKAGQHASSVDTLFQPALIDRERFDRLVTFRHADMRSIDENIGISQFDFLWSSCAFEHLGSLEEGMRFVCNAMRFLKSGGIAVHTTEFNLSSNDETLSEGPDVIYRRRDIDQLAMVLRKQCCGLEPVDLDPGLHPFDLNYDQAPYGGGKRHVKLEIAGFVCTSIMLIVHKGNDVAPVGGSFGIASLKCDLPLETMKQRYLSTDFVATQSIGLKFTRRCKILFEGLRLICKALSLSFLFR